jgi:UDP-N-acetyl-2-amino-2-deoxyglucuronate dehydrogenase
MSEIRIGIIGSGFMGLTHAAAVARTNGTQLAAIAGGRRAAGLAKQYGVPVEPDADTLLERTDIDAVIIATPHHVHARDTLRAFATGKHVLVEKPMATSLEDCDAMIEAAAKARRVLAVGFQQRFRQNNREARRLVREGALGNLLMAQINMLASMQPMLADPSFAGSWEWWRDPRSLGHIINAGPHAVDLLRWMFAVEVESVSGLCRSFVPSAQVEDTTAAVWGLSNGAVCTFNSSLMAAAPSFPGEEFRFRFLGTNAVMDLDPYTELRISREGVLVTESVQPALGHQDSATLINPVRMRAYEEQLAQFAAAIRGTWSDIANGEDGRVSLAVCLAMLASSRTASVQRPS